MLIMWLVDKVLHDPIKHSPGHVISMLLRPSIKKRLCCSSVVARLMQKQAGTVNSVTMRVVFYKRLASHALAVALSSVATLSSMNLLPFTLVFARSIAMALAFSLTTLMTLTHALVTALFVFLTTTLMFLIGLSALKTAPVLTLTVLLLHSEGRFVFFRRAGLVIGGA